MDDDICIFSRFCHLVSASHIPDREPESVFPKLILQPGDIARRACAGQVVKDGHCFTALNQPVGVVRSDKSRAPSDKVVSSHKSPNIVIASETKQFHS
jgi:hypothetical protein